MKRRALAVAALALVALCWLDAPKAQAYRGFGGFYRGGFYGRGFYGHRGFYGGFYRPWFRPWYGAWARPWWNWGINRPWFYAGYRPWLYRPYLYAGAGYSPYYYGNYYAAPYYGDSYDNYAPNNGIYISPPPSSYPPMMPRGDGTFLYNGGPRSLIPVPMPAQPLNDRFISVQAKTSTIRFPAYGEKSQPATTSTATAPSVSYPAYGDRPTVPATLVSNSKR